jgi:hypothetical protein
MHVIWRVLQRPAVIGKGSSCAIAPWPKWLVPLRSAAEFANAAPYERDLVHLDRIRSWRATARLGPPGVN